MMSKDLVLPGKATGTELEETYHGIIAKRLIIKKQLVVQTEIPLIPVYNTKVYELIKLSVKINDTVLISRLEEEFTVYNFSTNTFYVLFQTKLSKCGENYR